MNSKSREVGNYDYIMLGIFFLAILVLLYGWFFTDGYFCMTLEGDNLELEDRGEKCFKTLGNLKNHSKTMFEKYRLNETAEYSDLYINDNIYINNYSG